MSKITNSKQTDNSINKNVSFFRDNLDSYGKNIEILDTYSTIRAYTDDGLKGIKYLLDIGNGGVFDYETSSIQNIVALDLFLDDIDTSNYPTNITFKTGSALEIPEEKDAFDGAIMVMLLHHLVGETVDESLNNVRRAIREVFRILRPGGKLIIVESCVPEWFYRFEKMVFPLASKIFDRFFQHPVTIQYPTNIIVEIASEEKASIEVVIIPKGRWVLQYGIKFPSFLTPINPYRFIITKPK